MAETPRKQQIKKAESGAVSAASYKEPIMDLLWAAGGYLPKAELYQLLESQFRDHFSKTDHKQLTGRKLPKWKNQVAWALAQLAAAGLVKTVKRFVVLIALSHQHLAFQRMPKNGRNSFRIYCPTCERNVPLAEFCGGCGRLLGDGPKRLARVGRLFQLVPVETDQEKQNGRKAV